MRILPIAIAALALAACNQQAGNVSVAEADASGEAASVSLESAAAAGPVAPLRKEAALALMKERHENYEKIGDSMKAVSREMKAGSPNLAKVRASADQIAALAPKVPTWFPRGTGPDIGKTHARAEIWQKPADFKAKADAFAKSAVAFQAAARGGDLSAIRAAQGDLGKSCKACHDFYRHKD